LFHPFFCGIYTVFFCLSAESVNKERVFKNSWFMLGEVEPSFKEFLASPAVRFIGELLGVSCFSRSDAFD
jgi:hypothetical protein